MSNYPWEVYVDDVLSGREVACRWVRLACERHRRDLEHGHKRGLHFNAPLAQVAVAFFGMLRHWKGEWAGRPVVLEPVQQFWVASLMGWQREDGTRRFQTAYLEVARKNGKTTLAAGLALWLAFVEGEAGAEVYTAATKRDQAKICHNDAVNMVRLSPALSRRIKRNSVNLHEITSGSKLEPLSSDHNTLDGLNAHGIIADELHAWPGTSLWGVLKTATGSRRQPLMLGVTTAGTDRHGICYQQRDYVTRILTGVIEDDAYWGIIYTTDNRLDWPDLELDDDWQDATVWKKANPLLGTSKKMRAMEQDAAQAAAKPAELNNYLRWHLNIWTTATVRWVNPLRWAECGELPVNEEELEGRVCYAGLDLSQTYDLSAFVLVFPPDFDERTYRVIARFWLPENNMMERVKRDQVPYDVWARAGLIMLTPGDVIDYDFIYQEVARLADRYDIREVGFDRWGATQVMQQLQDVGGNEWVVPIGQGYASMSPAMKETERLYMDRMLAHGNNPVLSWMADNVVSVSDPAGNVKPDKSKAREKIDGMVALFMAVDRASRHQEPEHGGLIIL